MNPTQYKKIAMYSKKLSQLKGVNTDSSKKEMLENKTNIEYFADSIFLNTGLIIKWSKKEDSAENNKPLKKNGNTIKNKEVR